MSNFNKTYEFRLAPTDYLNKIFSSIPTNAFIDKGRCGIGGTTLEINNKNRCSLISAPTIAVLLDKSKSHPEIFIVYGDVSVEDIKQQLSLALPGQKIMSTPEGFPKIIKAAKAVGIYKDMVKNWFFLLDEFQAFVTESFRQNILLPFDHFWEFNNKSVISGTPFYFSDPRFNQLDHYKIRFNAPIGTIKLVDCRNPQATLNDFINQSKCQEGRVFIFCNSVTLIAEITRLAALTDVSIFVADDKEGFNKTKLGNLSQYFRDHPDSNSYSKFNFFSSKYFEGWDLKEKDATIILVSDVNVRNSAVSVNLKLVQAAGRYRSRTPVIYHLTNREKLFSPAKSIDDFIKEYTEEANLYCKQYTEKVSFWDANGRKHEPEETLNKFADIDSVKKIAVINPYKIDQRANEAHTEDCYNNIQMIKSAWEGASYKVEIYDSFLSLETTTTMKRKSKSQQLREDYQAIIEYRDNLAKGNLYLGKTPEERIHVTNPTAYEAAKCLPIGKMEELNYNVKQVRQAIILATNEQNATKLIKLMQLQFNRNEELSNRVICDRLNEIYRATNFKVPETGELKKAKATDIENWFDVEERKLKDDYGKYTLHGVRIIRAKFSVRIAA